MLKKLISIFVLAAMISGNVPAVAAEQSKVWVSEEFESYALNEQNIKSLKVISGLDTRVIEESSNKVLFSRAVTDPVRIQAGVKNVGSVTVMSTKIKFVGEEISGKIFDVTCGSKKLSFLKMNLDGSITLYDGRPVSGVSQGNWHTYTVVVDWKNLKTDVYVDKKCVLSDWILPSGYSLPSAVDFALDSNAGESNIYLDDIRIYESSELPWEMSFPSEIKNTAVLEFTPTTEIDTSVKTLLNLDFNAGTAGATVNKQGGIISHQVDDEGNGVIRMFADANTKSTSFFDVTPEEISNHTKYVVDFKMRVNELSSPAAVGLLDTKNSAGKWRTGYDVVSAGNIIASANSSTAGTFTPGEWLRFSVAYNINTGSALVYINGVKTVSHSIPTDFYPTMFRFDMINAVGGVHNTDYDWIRVYTGTELMNDDFFSESEVSVADKNGEYTSVMDPKDRLEAALEDKTVFMLTNDTMYIEGQKQTYADDSYKPLNINGTLMIPLNLLSLMIDDEIELDKQSGNIKLGDKAVLKIGAPSCMIGGKSVTLNAAPCEIDGAIYFPLRSVAEHLLGKKVDWDNRGFVVLSDSGINVTSDYHFRDRFIAWHPIDLIYRFMQFDNPTGEEIVAAIKSNFPNTSHPRILYTEKDIDYILDHIDSDDEWKKAYDELMKKAAEILDRDYSYAKDLLPGKKQDDTRYTFQPAMETLGTAYFLTGDAKYAAKGVEIMKYYAAWDSMDYETANLIIGHWAAAMGIGFDMFYNYMLSSDAGKADMQYIKNRILALAYADHILSYSGNGGPHWITMQDNFLGVVGGGLMTLILAVADEPDMQQSSEFLAENVLKSLEIAVGIYFPDGGYFEGIGYSTYMLENFTLALSGLFNTCGTDYGLGLAKGFSEVGDPFTYLQSISYLVGYHDASRTYSSNPVREFWAWKYNKPEQAEAARIGKALGGYPRELRTLYYYQSAIDKAGYIPDIKQLPLDAYFYGPEAGAFINDRETSTPVFAGFHGGWTNLPHDMLDLGEFVFESNGFLWAMDLGSDNYSLPGYWSTSGYKIYRKRPEGENCIVLNPQVDSDTYYGQALGAFGQLIDFEGGKHWGAKAAYDLTEAYKRDASKYIRGYYFGDGRNTFMVQDELSLLGKTELYWFMHTKAEIEIIDNTKAKLTTPDGLHSLTVDVYCDIPNYELKVMDAKPLSSSPVVEGQNANVGVRKLTIYAPNATGDVTISVKLSPDSGDYEYSGLTVSPISEWVIPDGEAKKQPKFSGVYIDGKLIDGFVPGRMEYTLELPYGTQKVPHVTASSNDAVVSVSQAQSFEEDTVITLTADGCKPIICIVKYNVSTDRPINVNDSIVNGVLPVTGVKGELINPVAANSQNVPEVENGPGKMIDNDFSTRCAQDGYGCWFEIDLGEVVDFSGIALAFYSGDKRSNKFDLLYSEDGTNYIRVCANMDSTGSTNEYESIAIPGRARYIRYIGKGASTTTWNSITEFMPYR